MHILKKFAPRLEKKGAAQAAPVIHKGIMNILERHSGPEKTTHSRADPQFSFFSFSFIHFLSCSFIFSISFQFLFNFFHSLSCFCHFLVITLSLPCHFLVIFLSFCVVVCFFFFFFFLLLVLLFLGCSKSFFSRFHIKALT